MSCEQITFFGDEIEQPIEDISLPSVLSNDLANDLETIIRYVCREEHVERKFIQLKQSSDKSLSKNGSLSYSVWILEPKTLEYDNIARQSTLCFCVVQTNTDNIKRIDVEFSLKRKDRFKEPAGAEERIYPNINRVAYRFPLNSENVVPYLYYILSTSIHNFRPSDRFGCCDLYKDCSDALRCLHPNNFYARCCWYRQNLEAGKVFYGKNKNC